MQQPYGVCVKAGARLNAVSRRVPAVPWQNENQCVCVRVCARHIISTKWSGTSSSSSSSSLLGSARRRGPSCTQRSNPERISGLQSIKRTRPPPGWRRVCGPFIVGAYVCDHHKHTHTHTRTHARTYIYTYTYTHSCGSAHIWGAPSCPSRRAQRRNCCAACRRCTEGEGRVVPKMLARTLPQVSAMANLPRPYQYQNREAASSSSVLCSVDVNILADSVLRVLVRRCCIHIYKGKNTAFGCTATVALRNCCC